MREPRRKECSFLLALLVAVVLTPGHVGAQEAAKENRTVTIEYIAHACFRVTSPAGKQVLVDPYASRVWMGYDFPPNVQADAVLISHPHYDHDGGEAMRRPVPWPPKTLVLRQPGTNQLGDITVVGYAGKHADPWGKEFGQINKPELLGGIEEWAKGEANVSYRVSHQQTLSFPALPKEPEVVIFKHSPLVKAPIKTKVPEQ